MLGAWLERASCTRFHKVVNFFFLFWPSRKTFFYCSPSHFLFGLACLSTKSPLGLSSPVALHLRHARAVTKGDGREEDELESQRKRRRDGKPPGEGRVASMTHKEGERGDGDGGRPADLPPPLYCSGFYFFHLFFFWKGV